MHCTLPRTRNDVLGSSYQQKATFPLKSLEQQSIINSEDYTESPVVWRNIHNRCMVLTFLKLASDGNCKILAVPLQCLDSANCATGHPQNAGRSSCGSHIRRQPRSKEIRSSNLLPENKLDRTARKCARKRSRKKGNQGKRLASNGGPVGIAQLASHQSDLQGNLNVNRDISEAISSLSDLSVTEKVPVSSLENPLKSNDLRFSDSRSLNVSSELDIALVSSDVSEDLKVDSSASDREKVEIRHTESLNSCPGQIVLNDVIGLADQRKETGEGNDHNAAKKRYQAKKAVNSPSTSRSCILGNSHNTGKENCHPVWQKVRRKVGNGCRLAKINSKIPQISDEPRNEEKNQTPAKVSGKLKRNHYRGSKQDRNCHLGKGSPSKKFELGSSNKSSHSNIVNVSEVISPSGSHRDRSRTGGAESLNPEPIYDSRVCCNGLQLNGDNNNSTANKGNECMEDGDSSLGEAGVNPHTLNSASCIPHLLANGVAQSDKENAITVSCRHKSTSVSTSQKWVPIGMKTHASTGVTCKPYISVGHCPAEAHEAQTVNVNSESDIPASTSEVESDFCPREEKGQSEPTKNCNSHVAEEQDYKVPSSSFTFRKYADQFQTDLDRIAKAIDHAHTAQLASEAVQVANGGPIAEIETLLHLSSPVLCPSHSISSCRMCSRNHSSSSLCIHERPDVPMKCLWEWYKKHGSFGLEIQGKDYSNLKRLGIDRFSFRAYFVPYLSAIQLFRTVEKQMRKSSAGDPDMCEPCENTAEGHLPVFPLLVPQASSNEIVSRAVEGSESHEPELILEYFELEQPRQRRPLYEKIQELVWDNGPSWEKAFGDPSQLNSINLRDLDPTSWYSVAWYPIYRIPEGNFRAAFLTYHSLGHLVRRNGIEDCVVSPVVGLQSYNAQGECWFQLRPSIMSQTLQIPSLDPSKILTERLRTLEEAASLMSRAMVNKGNNLTSVNKHPDYEFFLSRHRYC